MDSFKNTLTLKNGSQLKVQLSQVSLPSSKRLVVPMELINQVVKGLVHFVMVMELPKTTSNPQTTLVVSLELLFHQVHFHLHQLDLIVYGDRIMLSREMPPEKESCLPMLRDIEEWAKDLQSDPAHHIDLLLQYPLLIQYL